MTVTLVGSRAVKSIFPDAREPKGDWDFFSDRPVTGYPAAPGAHEHTDLFTDDRLGQWDWGAIAKPDELYTIKISHAFWEINGPQHWNKHASDIRFLSRHGTQFIRPLYDILLPIWKEKYKRNPVSLDKTADKFFADAVDRKYDHDSLHESVAYGDRPLYERVLKDGSEVAVDNAKFFAMDLETQFKLVREEIYATALERILIPGNYEDSPSAAYAWSLRRTATSLFKGEWALFLMHHIDELAMPDCNYLKRHLDNLHKLRSNGAKGV